MDRQRIDKWLWHARVVRTRTAAAALADKGRVRINGARIDAASRAVRVGDVLTIALDRIKVLRVAGFSERRCSAAQAALLYEYLQADPLRLQPTCEMPIQRPSKRDRRDIAKLKRPSGG